MPQRLIVYVLMYNLEMTCVTPPVPIEQLASVLLLNLMIRQIVEPEIYVKILTFATVPDS